MNALRVEVWWMALDLERDPSPEVWAALWPEERSVAERFPSRLRMREYAGARWLRAHACACSGGAAGASAAGVLFWSLAHDGGMAAVAVAAGDAIGVDAACTCGSMVPDAADLVRAWPAAPAGSGILERWMRAEALAKLPDHGDAERPVVYHTLRAGGPVAGVLATRGPALVDERILRLP